MKTKRFLLPLLLAVVIVGVSALAGFIHADSEAREAFGFALTGGATLPNGELKFGWERSDDAAELLSTTVLSMRGDRFPEYFGGAFFSLEDHHYCVYLTDMSKKAELVELLGSYADVVEFLPAKVSYNALYDLSQKLNAELEAAGIYAAFWGVDEMEQKVLLGIFSEFYEQGKEYLEKHYNDNEFIKLLGPVTTKNSSVDHYGNDDTSSEKLLLPNGELKFGWDRSDDAAELLDATAFKLRGDRFPEYFGGAFFSLEDHHYCVYLTDMSKKAELVELLGSYADVVEFLPGKISYNRLSELVSELNSELLQSGIVATSVGIDTMNQQVTIAFYPDFYEQGKEYIEKHYNDNEFIRLEGAAVIRFSENTDGLAARSKGCAS